MAGREAVGAAQAVGASLEQAERALPIKDLTEERLFSQALVLVGAEQARLLQLLELTHF
jgi:hypothetical protein